MKPGLRGLLDFLSGTPFDPPRGGVRRFASIVVRRRQIPLDAAVLKNLVLGILATQDDEISCDDCVAQLDDFVELTLAGKKAEEALPLVQQHLDLCMECKEEFELLKLLLQS